MVRSRRPTGRILTLAILWIAIVCGVLGLVAWHFTRPFEPPDELWQLNNQGVAYMEQFSSASFGNNFAKAVKVFEEVVRRWPKWNSGKFNLAVALLNDDQKPETLARARSLLQEVLQADDNDARAHYTLGFVLQYEAKPDEARPHFEKVCFELMPNDSHSWIRLGECLQDSMRSSQARPTSAADAPEALTALKCYERALELNPNSTTALYKLGQALRLAGQDERSGLMMERFAGLSKGLHDVQSTDYIWSGPLAEAIGVKLPAPRPSDRPLPIYSPVRSATFTLSEAARWATLADLEAEPRGGLLSRIRSRFGSEAAAFDFDKDGMLDLYLPASAIVDGRLRDTLFRNLGKGQFVDVTAEAGLDGERISIGCAVGDFDADGHSDLYITAIGGNALFRNDGRGAFEDVTERAGVAESHNVSLTALFLDVDHDADLDLIVANYGPLSESDRMFRDEVYAGGVANVLALNVGKARSGEFDTKDLPPLEVSFRTMSDPAAGWEYSAPTVGFVAADFDNDRDIDIVEINDSSPCRLLSNDRLMQWTATPFAELTVPAGRYNGGLVGDFNRDLRMDLILVSPAGPAVMLHNAGYVDELAAFKPAPTDLARLSCAQRFDAELDGWPDVLGRSASSGKIVLGSNRPRGMLMRPEWLSGLIDDEPTPTGVLAADVLDGGWPQLLVFYAGQAPTLFQTDGNGSNWIALRTNGRREKVVDADRKTMRSNPDGIGTRVIVHAGPSTVVYENVSPTTGLSHGLLPITVGLANRTQADAVRLRWPDGVEQAELSLQAKQTCTIEETQRRGTSCPLLFAWNGRRFEFITDFLGGGGIGYLVAPGVYSEPDPDEDVFIDSRQLVPDERGRLMLKIAEPMDEMTYLDAAWLEVIDHPNDLTVCPDERFDPAAPHPSGGRFVFRDRIVPAGARDHYGRDVLERLRAVDRATVDQFARSKMWIGYAEDHFVELDFGRSFAGLKADDRVALFLAGWVEYPYSQTNWAAATAGVDLKPPVLEWLNERGEWHPLIANMGYPAGLSRMMTLDLTGKLPAVVRGENGSEPLPLRLRIETNMEIYWDAIFAARLESLSRLRPTLLQPTHADFSYRGYLQEYTPDGREPKLFDYHQIISVPLVGLEGARTPYGDVRELVCQHDDRFVLINAGDEVSLTFDGRDLPSLPLGWSRSYVLRSFGYCKDTDLFNRYDRTVEPLPGRGR